MSRSADLLRLVQKELDIPEDLAAEAASEFRRVAEWLGDTASPLNPYNPDLYPQGSFRLGTPVRPVGHDGDFDIDLVCRLDIDKERTTQADLKKMVGDRLRQDPTLVGRLSESRRCWQLSYPPRYHLDVLPSIPDASGPTTSILITDKDLRLWQFSNPIGYADWFFDLMRVEWHEARRVLAESMRASIEDVPSWRIRTPLQRAVQLLKRHRDIHFDDDSDLRPVSVIITTLAGGAYRPRPDLAQTLLDLAGRMPAQVEHRDGKWWVENPAQPKENFADKWNEYPERKNAFDDWLLTLREDLEALDAATDLEGLDLIEERFAIAVSRGRPVVEAGLIPGLGDRSHAKQPPWLRDVRYRCEVKAQVRYRDGGRLVRLGRFLFKKNRIRFEASTDSPPPFDVYWQIVNTGAEASAAGQLRGGFDPGEGRNGRIRWEHTRYTGTHLVRAFVVKEGLLLAVSDPVMVRIAPQSSR